MGSVVEINPLTRVEGHGSVKVFFEGGSVQRVDLCLTDSPRLFEALLIGKSFLEVPEIVCRICALCSTIHKVTALLAVEKTLGIEPSEVTRLTRELIVSGGLIQDHALHLYCLVLPDLMGQRGVAELANEAPELVRRALRIKAVGNRIQETVGGRLIHPVNIAVGGLGQTLGRDLLLSLREDLLSILPDCRDSYQLFRDAFPFPQLPSPRYLALEPALPGESGRSFLMRDLSFPVDAYREHISEKVLPHSYAKEATIRGEEPTVGALSRLNLCEPPPGEAGAILQTLQEEITGKDIRANNLAQAIELCQAVERSLAMIEALLDRAGEAAQIAEITPAAGRGSAACEAPRGVLIHSYGFDERGLCTEADVITPTSLNQRAISRDLLALARGMEGADEAAITNAMERLIRCYDPCISCSVHLIKL